MRRKKLFTVSLIVFVFVLSVPAATRAMQETVKQLQVKVLTLKGKKSKIVAKGKRPVVIADSARVTKNLDVKGNITLGNNRTVDGVDVSNLAATVNNLDVGDSFPSGCSNGEVAKFNGSSWECADDVDANTTYTAGAGLNLSGTTFSLEGTSYQNMVVVAKSGGDYTTIQDAIDSIDDASSTNMYVVYVAPGVYTEQVTMTDYVHVVGAQKEAVTVTYDATSYDSPVITLADNSVVRDLTISITTTENTSAAAIYNNTGTAEVRNVKITAAAGTLDTYGIYNEGFLSVYGTTISVSDTGNAYGIYSSIFVSVQDTSISADTAAFAVGIYSDDANSFGAIAYVVDSTMNVGTTGDDSCYGLYATGDSSGATIEGSTISTFNCDTTNYGVYSDSGAVSVDQSYIGADDSAVYMDASTAYIGGSRLQGTVVGTATCTLTYDTNYIERLTTCEVD